MMSDEPAQSREDYMKSSKEQFWSAIRFQLSQRNWKEADELIDTREDGLIDSHSGQFAANPETLLEHFSKDEDNDIFTYLLKKGANWLNPAENAPYFGMDGAVSITLASHGAVKNMTSLLEHVQTQAPLHSRGMHGANLMHQAIFNSRYSFIALLLEQAPELLDERDNFAKLPTLNVENDHRAHAMINAWKGSNLARALLPDLEPSEKPAP